MSKNLKQMRELASGGDIRAFLDAYVNIREHGEDIGDDAARMLVKMGLSALEDLTRMLNDKSLKDEYRGTIGNLLLHAIDLDVMQTNTEILKTELIKALDERDFFIVGNAGSSLELLGVREVCGVALRKYVQSKQDKLRQDDWSNLFK